MDTVGGEAVATTTVVRTNPHQSGRNQSGRNRCSNPYLNMNLTKSSVMFPQESTIIPLGIPI
ncbi:hypothetical protein JOC69_000087 [Heliobacterium gestii]|nr:hypothetical protein [Heliomicrobium gestii]